jgi:ankyrin repeat protein
LQNATSEKGPRSNTSSQPAHQTDLQSDGFNDDGDDDQPPPYSEQPASSSFNTTRQDPVPGPSNSSGGSLASLAKSFKAFTSQFSYKTDPFASALCQAVLNGDSRQVSGLLGQGANVNGRNEQGKTPLQCAISIDNEALFEILIAAGASPKGSSWSGGGLPPLFQAAAESKLRIALALIQKGANVMEESKMGQPYFYNVCGLENLPGIEFLLQHGASATTENLAGRPVLIQAIRSGNLELTKLLLKYGADARCSDVTGSPAIALALEKKGTDMVTLLLDHGADPNAGTVFGNSLISEALSKSRLDLVRLFLDRGIRGDTTNVYGQPIIISVIKDSKMTVCDKEDLMERLFKNGASGDASDPTWNTKALPYVLESATSTPKMIELLLKHGAKTDDKMTAGETPLLYAMDKGKMEEAKLLVQYGASPNATDEKKRLPLMHAVVKGDMEMIRLLMSRGARVEAEGVVSVANVARLLDKPEMLKILGLNQ